MTWAHRNNDSYSMTMTSGYISPPQIMKSKVNGSSKELEQCMAQHLYRLAARLHVPLAKRARGPPIPDPIHTWVIGNNDWVAQAPPLFQSIIGDEKDPNYRMVIMARGLEGIENSYIGDLSGWLRCAGMPKKKVFQQAGQFTGPANTILKTMLTSYNLTGRPPSDVLEQYKVPYVFHGDSRSKRELPPAVRIQQ